MITLLSAQDLSASTVNSPYPPRQLTWGLDGGGGDREEKEQHRWMDSTRHESCAAWVISMDEHVQDRQADWDRKSRLSVK